MKNEAVSQLAVLTLFAPQVALAKLLWRPGANPEHWSVIKVEHSSVEHIVIKEPLWIVSIMHDDYSTVVHRIFVSGGDITRWLQKQRSSTDG